MRGLRGGSWSEERESKWVVECRREKVGVIDKGLILVLLLNAKSIED